MIAGGAGSSGTGGYLARPSPSGLADVLEVILDRGLVLDAYARVSLLGIELLTVDARIVVASVDTYLRFAEATGRLELEARSGRGLPELAEEASGAVIEEVTEHVVEEKLEPVVGPVRDALRGGVETVMDAADGLLDEDDEEA